MATSSGLRRRCGLEFAPMLACPRLLAARSLFGLLTPPKAPPFDEGCCWRLACCGAGRAAGCGLFCAGLDALELPVAGLAAGVLPVAGRAAGVLLVVGRVPPVWPKPRSPEGFLAGELPVATRLFAPALPAWWMVETARC